MALEQNSVVLFDSSDVETGTAANPLRVDPTGTTPQPVTGTVTANQGTPAVVGNAWPIKVTDGVSTAGIATTAPTANAPGLVVRVAGAISVTFSQPATGTVTSVSVTSTTTATTLLAANANRLGASFWNDGAQVVYVRLSAGATTALFTVRISNKGFYELQFPAYTGIVTGIVAAGVAVVLVTELT
jgi:hypothetical protein